MMRSVTYRNAYFILVGVAITVISVICAILGNYIFGIHKFEEYGTRSKTPSRYGSAVNNGTNKKVFKGHRIRSKNESLVYRGGKVINDTSVLNFEGHRIRSKNPFVGTRRNESIVISYQWTNHPFWKGGMGRFCDWVRGHLERAQEKKTKPTVVVNFTTKCIDPFHVFGLGTGNIVMAVYGLRLTAASLGVDFYFGCEDVPAADLHHDAYKQEVLPWLQGYFAAPVRGLGKKPGSARFFSPYRPRIPGTGQTCRGFATHPLHYMSEAMRHDLRRMALTLLGSSNQQKETPSKTDLNSHISPLLPNFSIDDVAIHLRCGDVVGVLTDTYGIVRFDSYRNNISPDASAIGIVTQPFEKDRNREKDALFVDVCRVIVESLVFYLKTFFPNATVTVRNGPEETVATAYARLVVANQSFSSMSTFSVFPVIASLGTSYIQKGRLSYFVPPIEEAYDDVQTMEGAVLTSNMIRKMKSAKEVVKWLMGT